MPNPIPNYKKPVPNMAHISIVEYWCSMGPFWCIVHQALTWSIPVLLLPSCLDTWSHNCYGDPNNNQNDHKQDV